MQMATTILEYLNESPTAKNFCFGCFSAKISDGPISAQAFILIQLRIDDLRLLYSKLAANSHHVEADEAHDDHIKLLVGDDREHNGLRLPGGPWQSLDRLFRAGLLHGGYVLLLVLSHESI